MTIHDVVENLFDGMEMTAEQGKIAEKELERLRSNKGWSYEQLDDWCWNDSTKAFDYIFGA